MLREYRVIIILGLLITLAFTFFALQNYHDVTTALRAEITTSSLPLLRDNIYSEMLKNLMPPINISSLMAKDSFLINWAAGGEESKEDITLYLAEIQKHYDYFSAFFVSAQSRNYYYHDGVLKTLSGEDAHDSWFSDFVASGLSMRLEVDQNQAAGDELTIFINFRLEDFEGNLLGVTGVGLKLAHFSEFLRQVQDNYQRVICLVDSSGYLQAHSRFGSLPSVSILDNPAMAEAARTMLAERGQAIDVEYERDGLGILATSLYMPEMDWFLVVEQDVASFTSPARSVLIQSLVLGLVTAVIVVILSSLLVQGYHKRLRQLASIDDLTGVANRREFRAAVEQAIQRCEKAWRNSRNQRMGCEFSLLILDLDNFKEINDRGGHLYGDQILKDLASLVRSKVRSQDLVGRFGGDEFVILFESSLESALNCAERIRHAVEMDGKLTLSAALASYQPGDRLDDLLKRADQGLYIAKSKGRNQIQVVKTGLEKVI